jgi:dynein heavy chain
LTLGDVLLSAAFVSYVGCFSKKYREELLKEHWIPYFKPDKGVKIPITDNFDPMDVLTNSSEVAKWSNEALPNDRISIENAVMLTNCKRWPLIIDPQLQGEFLLEKILNFRYYMG